MHLNQRAAKVIRSLMRDLAVSEHIVMPQGGPNIRATGVVAELEGPDRVPTAADVLSYLDYFAGQETTAEDVRDFVQKAARLVDEGATLAQWRAHVEFDQMIEWMAEQCRP